MQLINVIGFERSFHKIILITSGKNKVHEEKII